MQKPLFILFIHLGLGGVERKIVEIVNYLANYRPNLPIYILLRKKTEFDMSQDIKNKKVQIVNYLDWAKIKAPYFFPFFVFYHVWKLKPQAILAFLDFCSIPAIWAKLLFFWRKFKLVFSEDHYASRIISTYHFAPLRHLLVRIFYPFADVIFTCTQATKEDLIQGYGLPKEKIKIMTNWTHFGQKKPKLRRKKYDLLYVGRLAKTKNLDCFLPALEKLRKQKPEIKLCFVGEGEERENLEKLVKRKHLERNVEFAGARHDVENFYARARILVFFSQIEAEGFPLVILEAMAVGTPVLSRDFAGAKEYLQDGKNCYLFRTEQEFLKKALWLLDHPKEREKVAFQARRYVRKHHSPENMKVYFEALNLT